MLLEPVGVDERRAVVVGVLPEGMQPELVVAAGITVLLSGFAVVGAGQDAIGGYNVTAAGRAAEIGVQSAGLLTGAGRLWMVANRHLPYEAALAEHFADVAEIGGDNRFKIISATGARRAAPARPRLRRR